LPDGEWYKVYPYTELEPLFEEVWANEDDYSYDYDYSSEDYSYDYSYNVTDVEYDFDYSYDVDYSYDYSYEYSEDLFDEDLVSEEMYDDVEDQQIEQPNWQDDEETQEQADDQEEDEEEAEEEAEEEVVEEEWEEDAEDWEEDAKDWAEDMEEDWEDWEEDWAEDDWFDEWEDEYDDWDYYYDDYYDYDYDYGYDYDYDYEPYAPSGGKDGEWKTDSFCGGFDPNYDEALVESSFDDYWNGFSDKSDCLSWCRDQKKALGEGTCCGHVEIYDTYFYDTYGYCALYDSPKGEFDQMDSEYEEDYIITYSAAPVDKKDKGIMEQAQGWLEDILGNSSNQMVTAFIAMAAAASFSI
jgi:hypothetical protein